VAILHCSNNSSIIDDFRNKYRPRPAGVHNNQYILAQSALIQSICLFEPQRGVGDILFLKLSITKPPHHKKLPQLK
jgi:hypothetical protein